MKPAIVDEPAAQSVDKIRGDIEFRDVWFSYVPDEWVLKGVSFHIHAGETIAFVGSTGSGKSTILSLICRNYDIQKGEILIDGLVWRVGYWGDRASLPMMAELAAVLEKQENPE